MSILRLFEVRKAMKIIRFYIIFFLPNRRQFKNTAAANRRFDRRGQDFRPTNLARPLELVAAEIIYVFMKHNTDAKSRLQSLWGYRDLNLANCNLDFSGCTSPP